MTTDAAGADITQLPALLHGAETTLCGDNASDHAEHWWHWEASGERYLVYWRGQRTLRWDRINAARSRTRSRAERVSHVVKRLWGFARVRYRGLAKNTVRVFAAFSLANLRLVWHELAKCAVPQGT